VVFIGVTGEDEMEFNSDVYVMNANGSGVRRVTRSGAYEESPSFFPDGQRIAFAKYSRDDADIFTKTIGTPGSTRLTDSRAFEESVAVSPDGTRIAFTRYSRNGADIFAMNAASTGTVNLTKTDQSTSSGRTGPPMAGR
jgi:TolB protein